MNLFSIYKIIGKTAYTSEGLKQGLNFMFVFASIALLFQFERNKLIRMESKTLKQQKQNSLLIYY